MARLSGRLNLALVGLLGLNALLLIWVVVIAPRMEAQAASDIGRGDYELVQTDGSSFTLPSRTWHRNVYSPDRGSGP